MMQNSSRSNSCMHKYRGAVKDFGETSTVQHISFKKFEEHICKLATRSFLKKIE